jgi:hypothetical protein
MQGDFDAQNSSSDDELPSLARSVPYHAAMWNEEFILDVPPDVIHRSKVVVELCFEGSVPGEQLLAGLVEPAIGFEDLVRAREYNEWHPLVGKKYSCVYEYCVWCARVHHRMRVHTPLHLLTKRIFADAETYQPLVGATGERTRLRIAGTTQTLSLALHFSP